MGLPRFFVILPFLIALAFVARPAHARERAVANPFQAREITFYGPDDTKKPKAADAVDALLSGPLFGMRAKLKDSKEFYRSSCILDHVRSCVMTGMFEYDDGNADRAEFLFSNACDEGDALGCRGQGFAAAREGRLPAAIAPLEKSCDSGDSESCSVLRAVQQRLLNKTFPNE